jgi:hypothetical protein
MDKKTNLLSEFTKEKSAAEIRSLSRQSYTWLKSKIADLKKTNIKANDISRTLVNDKSRYVNKEDNRFNLGGLYFFYYNPLTKRELPYYDIFPLVIPIETYSDGFLGLNLHYLPLNYRVLFLNKLKRFAVLDKNNEIKRLQISYEILNASKKYKEFKPCIKRYHKTNIRSKIITVQPGEWDVAMALPVQQFVKESAVEVWDDSVQKIKKS